MARRRTVSPIDGIHTPDGRYLVVRKRLWRAANPALPVEERARWTKALMAARREVGRARRAGDVAAVARARAGVDRAKRALGERGPVWWTDGARDYNRHLVQNTPYAGWFLGAERFAVAIPEMLHDRGGSSICPSDVARAEEPQAWRAQMDVVRAVARHLARKGLLVVTQRGRAIDPDSPPKGPIRLALPIVQVRRPSNRT
jgi:hypothetical protein